MLMNEYIVVFYLITVICLLVYLQYALGVKKASARDFKEAEVIQ